MENIDEIIKKYPRIFEDYEGNPDRVNWSCPYGWLEILELLCYSIQSYIDFNNKYNKHLGIEQVKCIQVKEKFGSFCFYYNGGDKKIEGMVEMAQSMVKRTCKNCGENNNVNFIEKSGLIGFFCTDCYINLKK